LLESGAFAIAHVEGNGIVIKCTILGVVNLVEGSAAGPGCVSGVPKANFEEGDVVRANCHWLFGKHANQSRIVNDLIFLLFDFGLFNMLFNRFRLLSLFLFSHL
jgi:hypothetical protein